VRLRGVVGIVAAAMQRVLRRRGAETSAHAAAGVWFAVLWIAIQQRHTYAQSAKIYACNDGHVGLGLRLIVVVHVHPR